MKLLQVNRLELASISQTHKGRYLVVESQNYGSDDDLLFHILCPELAAEDIKKTYLVREIADKGRTIGFWQNLGGSGIYRPDLIAHSFVVPQRLHKYISTLEPANIGYKGDTWAEIFNSIPALHKNKRISETRAQNEPYSVN